MLDYSKFAVILDPGHSKETPGKRSPYSANKVLPGIDFYEYQFNREVTAILKRMLENQGIDVFVTTDEDRDGTSDLGLTARANRANDYAKKTDKKCIFISIHANAFGNGSSWSSPCGWSIYTTKGQNNSDKLATCIWNAANDIFPAKGYNMRKESSDGDPDYEENFTVIYKTNMPAVLTENFFYTNIKDT